LAVVFVLLFWCAASAHADDARTARTYAENRWCRPELGSNLELRFDRIEPVSDLTASFTPVCGQVFRVSFTNPDAPFGGRHRFDFTVFVTDGIPSGIGFEEEALKLLERLPRPVTTAAEAEERIVLFSRLMCFKPQKTSPRHLPALKDGFWRTRRTFVVDPFSGTRVTYRLRVSPEGLLHIDDLGGGW
jgi:hypothetical protein